MDPNSKMNTYKYLYWPGVRYVKMHVIVRRNSSFEHFVHTSADKQMFLLSGDRKQLKSEMKKTLLFRDGR